MGSISQSPSFLIFGNGWIANQFKDNLVAQGKTVVMAKARTDNREQVVNELVTHKPGRVINCAGTRGTPNVDWCEDHKIETIRSNVLGTLNVVDVCYQMGIHVTQVGSACIYTVSEEEFDTRPPFKETDEPFFEGSWYSYSRLLSERAIRHYPNLLLLRVRVPIGADLHKNNHVTKLLGFKKIVDSTGSGCILPNLVPGGIILSEHEETGIYNFVTPGDISNVEIMELAKKYIRPDLKWEMFDLKALSQVSKAPRSSAILDGSKLKNKLAEYGYQIKERPEAMEEVFQIMAKKGL